MGGFLGRIRGTSMGERRKDKRRREKADAAPHAQRKPLRGSPAARPFLLAVLSALLLTLAFPPTEISWLAYLAPAPLLVMAVVTVSRRHVFWAGWLGGFAFFGWNLWWVWPISLPGTAAGWAALTAYMGLYWAVFFWFLRRLEDTSPIPLTLAAPVLWVGLEYVRGWLLSGFPWIYIGHTQYENLVLVQTADALGAYGPGFLVLMTAGLAVDFLTRPLFVCGADGARRRFCRVLLAMAVVVACAWAATVGYGVWRLGHKTTRPGPVVASVQTSIPQKVKNIARAGGRGEGAGDEKPVPVPRQEAERFVDALLDRTAKDLAEQNLGANVADLSRKAVADEIAALREELVRKLVAGDANEARAEDLVEAVFLELQMLLAQVRLTGEALAAAEELPDLIVWPETMVPVPLNPEFLTADLAARLKYKEFIADFAFRQRQSQRYGKWVRDVAALGPSPMLVGNSYFEVLGLQHFTKDGKDYVKVRTASRNEALLIEPRSPVDVVAGRYTKAHLVPFGEYVPFKNSWPWLYERLHALTPYRGMEYSLTPGAHDQEPFRLAFDGQEARFQAAICYEDAMAYRVREMVRPSAGSLRKAVDFIVNISNDGWFTVKKGDDPWGLAQTAEHRQHLNLCVFRAIENRVPVVRSVNTGISAVIASDGRIVAAVTGADPAGGDLSGWLVERIALDDRLSPYTRVGDVFALACVGASVAGGIAVLVAGLRSRKETKP